MGGITVVLPLTTTREILVNTLDDTWHITYVYVCLYWNPISKLVQHMGFGVFGKPMLTLHARSRGRVGAVDDVMKSVTKPHYGRMINRFTEFYCHNDRQQRLDHKMLGTFWGRCFVFLCLCLMPLNVLVLVWAGELVSECNRKTRENKSSRYVWKSGRYLGDRQEAPVI